MTRAVDQAFADDGAGEDGASVTANAAEVEGSFNLERSGMWKASLVIHDVVRFVGGLDCQMSE